MDETKAYLEMCDCPEIQGQKEEFKAGDWFAYYESRARKPSDLVIAIVGVGYYEFKREEATKDTDGTYFRLSTVGFDEGDCELGWGNKIIWLPRQDQIQKMLDYGIGALVNDFNEFCVEDLEMYGDPGKFHDYQSMEQLWLTFYMHERHEKTWDGKKWIKK